MNSNYVPKDIAEEVNVTPINPLGNFAYLLGVVVSVTLALYLGLGWVAEQLVGRISPEMEVEIGRRVIPVQALERADRDEPRLDYVEDLLNSLRDRDSAQRAPLTVRVLDESIPNAGLFPGGHVVVTEGLLDSVQSENALAFVLAHELGHFEERDALRGLGRSLVFVMLASALGIGGSTANSSAQVVSVTSQLAALRHSRRQEFTADEFALAAVVDRYGHGDRSLDFFEHLLEQGHDKRVADYFSTHPLTRDRIERLYRLAEERGWSMSGEVEPLPY
ncbi:M48 family metallopeptidase [Synechococcus sp. PCC 7336]|uniref:M48 family metallopeptidase n=1 Tax=Synechococcus sp. PCC 7336 TaxID=195250 RepID=UPI000347A064|nr:M48 family metallopeptidase [Synechococcus sp. PCC 7336]